MDLKEIRQRTDPKEERAIPKQAVWYNKKNICISSVVVIVVDGLRT